MTRSRDAVSMRVGCLLCAAVLALTMLAGCDKYIAGASSPRGEAGPALDGSDPLPEESKALVPGHQKLWGVDLHLGALHHDVPTMRTTFKDLGLNSPRLDLYWSNYEEKKGEYAWPSRLANLSTLLAETTRWGIRPFAVLDYGNKLYFEGLPKTDADREAFASYVRAVTEAHGRQLSGLELWNEWNIGGGSNPREKGSAEQYYALLKKVRPVTNEHAPGVPLVVGAVAYRAMDWIEELIDLGGLSLSDGLSVHPYNFAARDASAEEVVRWLDGLHEKVDARAKKRVPIYVSEIGWPNMQGRGGSSENVTAQRLFKFMLMAASRGYIAGVWWYDLVDDGTDPMEKEHHFGLLRRDASRKPAFETFRTFLRLFKDARFVKEIEHRGARALEFRDRAGKRLVAAWSAETEVDNAAKLTGSHELLDVSPAYERMKAELAKNGKVQLGDWPAVFKLGDKGKLQLVQSSGAP